MLTQSDNDFLTGTFESVDPSWHLEDMKQT